MKSKLYNLAIVILSALFLLVTAATVFILSNSRTVYAAAAAR